MISALLGNDDGKFSLFLARAAHGLFPDLTEKAVHGIGRLCHRVIKLVGGEIGVSEKFCLLLAQFERALDDLAIVGLAAILTARHPGLECLFAQIATFGEGQEGLDDGARQRDGEFAVLTMLTGGTRHRIAQKTGNAGQLLLRGKQKLPVLLVRQHILPEFGAETGKLFIDRRQPLLPVFRQFCAGTYETLPVPFENTLFLTRQPERLALFPQ
ncbi:hypothetical protein D3C80_763460 [compost metagenome]